NSFIAKLDRALSFPESRLAAGLVVAGKKSLPKSIQDDFQKSGTLQVVVLSGYNVTIVAEMLMGLLKTIPRVSYTMSAYFGITGIVFFVVMAGGSATIVRGAIMAIMVIVAKSSRRRYGVTRALIITAACMLLYNPLYLFYDPSFQLSFLATAGLIYVSPLLEKRLLWITERLSLRSVVATTLGAQLAVTPLLLYSTGELSLVALPANIFISFLVPLTMLMCFITGLLGYIHMFLAFPISLFAFCLLTLILQMVHIFSAFPFASVALPYFPMWCVILIYIGSSVLLIRFYNRDIGKTKSIL
ncbi:MAG: ComEC/Rec2 family competence protein, partial [bacterium]|nr:ComEC/Rec2 family competence protein [bacterium]